MLKDNDYKWDVEKGKERPQCAMVVNSELYGPDLEWDSEETKLHLHVIVRIQKQHRRVLRVTFTGFGKVKSIFIFWWLLGDHIRMCSRASAQSQDKQTGQYMRLLRAYAQLRYSNCQAHAASRQYGNCV